MRPLAVAGVAVWLTLGVALAQAPTEPAPSAADAEKADKGDAPEKDEKEAAADPTKRDLEVTGNQCEALSLGRTIKDLPADAQVDAISFVDPPPVTFRLPDQRREALTECNLRAAGLTVRIDPARKAILLLPRDTSSPTLANPKIRVSLKLGGEAAKPEQ